MKRRLSLLYSAAVSVSIASLAQPAIAAVAKASPPACMAKIDMTNWHHSLSGTTLFTVVVFPAAPGIGASTGSFCWPDPSPLATFPCINSPYSTCEESYEAAENYAAQQAALYHCPAPQLADPCE